MNSLNKASLIGNLTKDPELKTLQSGQKVCSFSLATNRQFTDKAGTRHDEPEYHNIVAWGRLAEICGQYLVKGKKIYVDGRIRTRDWEAQDGQKRYRTEIVAENMIMLDGKKGGTTVHPDMGGIETHDEPASDEIKLEDIPF